MFTRIPERRLRLADNAELVTMTTPAYFGEGTQVLVMFITPYNEYWYRSAVFYGDKIKRRILLDKMAVLANDLLRRYYNGELKEPKDGL